MPGSTASQDGSYYNLKAVVRQTGLKPDKLRAWERRYGLPTPLRSGGRQRLYSQRDIQIIHWLVARQGEGMSISRAVELWHQLEAVGQDPLQVPLSVAAPSILPAGHEEGAAVIARLGQTWIEACLAYDEHQAEEVLNQAFALLPPETVCLEILQKAMAEVGERWYRGEITVQQEHFTSALAIRRLESLIMAAPAPLRSGCLLLACPPGEQHVFGLLLLMFLLRRQGWPVVYLGADVPLEQLETTVRRTGPQLVILAAQQLRAAAALKEMAETLQPQRVPLAYGGRVFNRSPGLRNRIPGHFLGERLELAPTVVERLVATPRPEPVIEAIPQAYRQARQAYRDRRGLIEAEVLRSAAALGFTPGELDLANRELGLNIDAALCLGDGEALGVEVEWLKGLLRNRHVPETGVMRYLWAYYEATARHVEEAKPVVAWLGRLVGSQVADPPGVLTEWP